VRYTSSSTTSAYKWNRISINYRKMYVSCRTVRALPLTNRDLTYPLLPSITHTHTHTQANEQEEQLLSLTAEFSQVMDRLKAPLEPEPCEVTLLSPGSSWRKPLLSSQLASALMDIGSSGPVMTTNTLEDTRTYIDVKAAASEVLSDGESNGPEGKSGKGRWWKRR